MCLLLHFLHSDARVPRSEGSVRRAPTDVEREKGGGSIHRARRPASAHGEEGGGEANERNREALNLSRNLHTESVIYFVINLCLILQICVHISDVIRQNVLSRGNTWVFC